MTSIELYMRFQYRHPRVYEFLIRFIYPEELTDKFSSEVGKDQSVFDIAAGYGRIAKYLDPTNSYYGVDLNEIFVKHGQRQGLNLELKNIFEESSYKPSDVFTVVDIVHHLTEDELEKLFNLIFKFAAKKVVVVEPAFVNLASRHKIWGKLADWFFSKVDYDGFNRINRWFTNAEYSQLFREKFGSAYGSNFSLHHQELANHHLVTFARQ